MELNYLRAPPRAPHSSFLTEDNEPESPQNADDVFTPSISYENDVLASIRTPWKRDLHALLEQATSSRNALTVHVFITFLIVVSALVTVLETIPAFHSISTRFWFGFETCLVVLFTIEYVARCLAWSATWQSFLGWIFSFYGIIDLLSVLPYYIEIILRQDTSVFFRFSILRMFRLLRVLRPFRYNHTILLTIEVMYLSVRRSQHALLAIGFFVFMILTVFSTLLYFAERGVWDETLATFVNADGDPTQFSSIPAAAWFVLVTITTVGYGEITPRSVLGRFVTLPLLVFGLLLITLPSFVLGREFSHVWEKMSRNRLKDETDEQHHTLADININHQLLGSHAPSLGSRDLSNLKLAQNQIELSRQIRELGVTVDRQGRAMQRLLQLMEAKPKNYDHPE